MQSEQDDQQNPDPLSHSWLQLQREVLLSYRLIFGQDKKSCKLFARILKEDRKGKNLLQDPLLETLCTKAHNSPSMRRLSPSIWPKSCISLENELRKQEEYDVQGDFPILGQRLLAVQNFNLRQRPRTFWAFWKDTRDRPGWFTAWLALIIGGITFLLGLLQLLLAIASLAHDITSAGGIAQGNSTRS
jgi:hypothetical protein